MKRLIIYIIALTAAVASVVPAGCRQKTAAWSEMNHAENFIETNPDSALSILSAIDRHRLGDDEERARYALLMSMALDKNYIDTTSFDVLQPAIDYYLRHGSPDERLRTFYYQSCIYRNRGDDGNAMASCIEALNIEGVTDTLVLARTLIGQGALYDKQYKIDEFAENNLRAAKLYQSAGDIIRAIRCYAKALNGAVVLKMKNRADSLAEICTTLVSGCREMEEFVDNYLLLYVITYGNNDEILSILEKHEQQYADLPADAILDMAQGYSKIGKTDKALALFDNIAIEATPKDSLKYYAVKSDILETAGNHLGALNAYKRYLYTAEHFHESLFNNDLLFAEKKHDMEISNMVKVQKKDKVIRYSLFAIIALMVTAIIIIFRYYSSYTKRIIAEQDNLRLRMEKHTAELELENLRLEKSRLEREHDNLKELLNKHKEISEPIRGIIKQRLDLLNGLLAKEISDNDSYAAPYRDWIEYIRKNKEEFLNSTRIALTASYPTFMNSLETYGLTDDEIKYVCLYAIGLKGKEVGEYMQLKRHYNISSSIRKKLGIDEHETNIGLYIRRSLTSFS